MPDKITRKEAIEVGELSMPYIELTNQPYISVKFNGKNTRKAVEVLLSTAKKYEKEVMEEALKIILLRMEMGRKDRLVEKAEKIVKKYEEVVGLVKDSMSQARMHRNDIWLHGIERILSLLTEEEP